MSGEGCDSSTGVGGSKKEKGGMHLMLDSTKSKSCSKEFESRVEDSVELEHGAENGVGHLAQNNLVNQEDYLAQEGTIDLGGGAGPIGPGSINRDLGSFPGGPNSINQGNMVGVMWQGTLKCKWG